jgi:hypothetical protein
MARRNGVSAGINGNRKGKVGERELAAVLRQAGYDARRAQQFCGAAGDEDITHTIPGLHVECKRVEKLNVLSAWKQAKADAKPHKTPVVMHRCNRGPWMLTMSLEDFLAILRVDDGLSDTA